MAKTDKKPDNPGANPGILVDGPRGGKLRRGGTNKGGPGRPPNEYREHMRKLVNRADVQAYHEACIRGDFGPKFHLLAMKEAEDRAYGKPTQAVEVSGPDGQPLFKSYVGVDTDKV